MANHSKRLATTLFLFLLSVAAYGGKTATIRSYPLPDHGHIDLSVPASWQDKVRQPRHRFPPTIVFTPENGFSFRILVTPLWEDGKALPDREQLRQDIDHAIKDMHEVFIENEISIKEIKGESDTGYYFSATMRSPKPGEYRHVTQGMLTIGKLTTAFTVLTNDGNDDVVADALRMLAGATQSQD